MTLILTVDDKKENLYYLRVLLTGHGFEVESARHGAEALFKARAHPPDLVISDLLMPVMDGYTLLRHWKADARLKRVPFIVYTATYTEAADEELALSLGADAFILKPAEPDDFLARIREVRNHAATAVPATPKEPQGDEATRLRIYSETLIRKLEEKTLQLEEANRALRDDIEHRKEADLALRNSLREREALLKEVHHRVKNNMQVVTSLLRLEAGRIDHPTTCTVLRDMQNRIQSMAALHETLYQTGSFAQVDLASYLRQVTTQLVRALARPADRIELHLDLASAEVDPDQAIPCGLIVNELVTNAFKHGFPPGSSGAVKVGLSEAPGGDITLRVSDDGVGLPEEPSSPKAKTLGLELVSDLTRQLRGNLNIGPGSSFEVTFNRRLE